VGKSWYDLTSQAFAVFLPVKSVGVMGDGRTYDYVVALRAVQTTDFMTAHWAHLPYALLGRCSNRIINEVRGSTAWCTTSRASRLRRSSGSDSASGAGQSRVAPENKKARVIAGFFVPFIRHRAVDHGLAQALPDGRFAS
jgi:hypothetical protein